MPTLTPIGGGTGKIVYISGNPNEEENLWVDNIFTMNVDGSNKIQITKNTRNPSGFADPSWSMVSDEILYSNGGMFMMGSDGSGVQLMSPSDGRHTIDQIDDCPDLSPDGQYIAFSSNRNNRRNQDTDLEIYIMDTSTYTINQLTNISGWAYCPVWSPDGTMIAFHSGGIGWTMDQDIYVMRSDGTEVRQLTKNKYRGMNPEWSPDGSKILFSSDRDGNYELYIYSMEDQTETRLTINPAREWDGGSWSPDGEWIVFESDRDGDRDIYVMRSDGSEVRNLTNNDVDDHSPNWSP